MTDKLENKEISVHKFLNILADSSKDENFILFETYFKIGDEEEEKDEDSSSQ